MHYDERIAAALGYLRAAKHGVEIRALLEKLKFIYPDCYASAYRMFRRDIHRFNDRIGASLGCSIQVANRPVRCWLEVRSSNAE